MPTKEQFIQQIEKGYTHKGEAILLGGSMLDKEVCTGSFVTIPLKTMNRHGLIAGATGSGKTKTLQILAEQLSAKGVPVLLMDVKGDPHPRPDQTSCGWRRCRPQKYRRSSRRGNP